MNRKEYEERIAKLEKELEELKEAEIEDDEFPKHNEDYWFVDSYGDIVGTQWCGSGVDSYRKTFLRIFRTGEECERYLEIQKAFKEESKNFEPNWNIFFITTMMTIALRLISMWSVKKQFYILKAKKY